MDRRRFLKKGGLLGSLAFAGTDSLFGTAAGSVNNGEIRKHSFQLNYAPKYGMFEHHAGEDPVDQIRFLPMWGLRRGRTTG